MNFVSVKWNIFLVNKVDFFNCSLLYSSVLLFLLASSTINAQESTEKFIDMHVHVAGVGAGESGAFVDDNLRNGLKFPIYLRAFDVTMREIEAFGDRIVIEKLSRQISESEQISKAVVLALDGVVDSDGNLDKSRTQVYVPNRYLIKELAQYDNLLFGASVNPLRHDALDRLEFVSQNGTVLLKWLPNIMLFDPSDERIIPFYIRLRELGIPLLSHTGNENAFGYADDTLGDPRKLELALEHGVTVIMAHIGTRGSSGGVNYFDAAIEMLTRYDNAYADISSLTQVNKLGFLGRALRTPGIEEKLINGSDWPLQLTVIVSPFYQIGRISLADMISIQKIENVWDRDVELKRRLGVPDTIFRRSTSVLRLPIE